MENVKTNVETKVCKVCGKEKPVGEYHSRGGGYYRTTCKVCMVIKNNKLEENDIWSMEEYHIVIDSLLNRRVQHVNEIVPMLPNKTLKNIVILLSEKLKLGSIPLKVIRQCDNCGGDIEQKLYKFLEDGLRFCSVKCSTDHNRKNNSWSHKPKDTPDWIDNIDEFITNYRVLGRKGASLLYGKHTKTITYWADKYNITSEIVINSLSEFEVIHIFNLVLNGKLKSFPNGFSKHKQYKYIVLKHLFDSILNWGYQDICNQFDNNILEEYKLDSIIKIKESKQLIIEIYSEYNIKLWEFKKHVNFPSTFWKNENNINEALEWLKYKLKLDKNIINGSDLIDHNLNQLLCDYNLDSLCIIVFNRDSEKLFSKIFNEDIKESNIIVLNKCLECGETKDFTNEFFPKGNVHSLFYLKNICLECMQKRDTRDHYRDKGIIYDNITDVTPVEWWKYYYNGTIIQMPKHCYNQENLIEVVRYIVFEKMGYVTREEICENVNCPRLNEYRFIITNKFSTVLEMLQICFPEYGFKETDMYKYDDITAIEIIDNWMKSDNITVKKILNSYGITGLFNKEVFNLWQGKRRYNNINNSIMSHMDLFIWFFGIKNILHPITKLPIVDLDFVNKTDGFWDSKENRIRAIKHYCENQCKESILDNINKYQNLQLWVLKYFNKTKLRPLYYFNTFKIDTYDLLVESYPIIKENNILFQWELSRNANTSVGNLLEALRNFVNYRMNDLILDIKNDLPTYLNFTFMTELCPKFCAYLQNSGHRSRKFTSFYEWACLAFPEYSKVWNPEDFGLCLAYDGVKCDSKQEIMVYESIKRDLNIKGICAIGSMHSGKYTYKYNGINKICPDFVIDCLNDIELDKPVIIEYYGLYLKDYQGELSMFKNYQDKILLKNNYYKSRDDIIFIDLYPYDLKNNCEGVKNKLIDVLSKLN